MDKKINENEILNDEDLAKVSGGANDMFVERKKMAETIEEFYDTAQVRYIYNHGERVKYFTDGTSTKTAFGTVAGTRVGWIENEFYMYFIDEYYINQRWVKRGYLVKKEYW